jgi:very-short-patch-repair endonuclease
MINGRNIQQYARTLRSNQSPTETWLWRGLTAHRFSVVELDGGYHSLAEAQNYDQQRSEFLHLLEQRCSLSERSCSTLFEAFWIEPLQSANVKQC